MKSEDSRFSMAPLGEVSECPAVILSALEGNPQAGLLGQTLRWVSSVSAPGRQGTGNPSSVPRSTQREPGRGNRGCEAGPSWARGWGAVGGGWSHRPEGRLCWAPDPLSTCRGHTACTGSHLPRCGWAQDRAARPGRPVLLAGVGGASRGLRSRRAPWRLSSRPPPLSGPSHRHFLPAT